MGELDGKRALVTGGAQGLGLAISRLLVERGAQVLIADIDEAGAKGAADELGEAVRAVRCDVTVAHEIEAAVQAAVSAFGGLDIMINNAGIEIVKPLFDQTEEEFDRLMEINVKGVWLGMKAVAPAMAARGGGAIVNTASVAGLIADPGMAAYVAAKHGVVGLTKAAALDYAASNIRINAVCPGIIDTPMMDRFSGGTNEGRERVIAQEPVGRMGRPEEIASAVMWMCSDNAGFLIGHALVMDGGQTA